LNIYGQSISQTSWSKPLWQKQGNKGDQWLFGHFYLDPDFFSRVRFMIEAIVIFI
jgi:hypothetical protein